MKANGKHPAPLPFFVVSFLQIAAVNSAELVPTFTQEEMVDLSRWALLISIAAVRMKTSLKEIFKVGAAAILLVFLQKMFIASFVLIGFSIL